MVALDDCYSFRGKGRNMEGVLNERKDECIQFELIDLVYMYIAQLRVR